MASWNAEMALVLRTPPENVSIFTDALDNPEAKPPTKMAGAPPPALIRPALVTPPATVANVTEAPVARGYTAEEDAAANAC
jgi:hypothetical protein